YPHIARADPDAILRIKKQGVDNELRQCRAVMDIRYERLYFISVVPVETGAVSQPDSAQVIADHGIQYGMLGQAIAEIQIAKREIGQLGGQYGSGACEDH